MRVLLVVAACLVLAVLPAAASANGVTFRPGAPGIGDPYFPLDGNGGYDVAHYDLNVLYDPDTDTLRGLEKIDVTAKQDLSSFNLDLDGLTVRAVLVDGDNARFSRDDAELTIKPKRGIRRGDDF